MRELSISLFFIVLICSATAALPDTTQIDAITLERTSCFGTCPVYKVSVRRDGSVAYDGKQFVRVTGHRTHKIPEAFEPVESSGEFIGCGFTPLPRFLLSGEFPTPSSATMMKSVCCRKTGSLNQRLRFRCGHRPTCCQFLLKIHIEG